ncbi:MAG: hypothetical protein R2695_06255 [Acidimicrobiales bacterium]
MRRWHSPRSRSLPPARSGTCPGSPTRRTARLAHANVDPERALTAWDEGVAVVNEHRVEFFAGLLARDAARVHMVGGDPDAALRLFGSALEAFQRAGNVAQSSSPSRCCR